MALIADNICVSLSSELLLKNASIQCKAGEIIALCGPNGAGKSALLNVLTGQLPYQSGSVMMNNRNLKTYSTKQLALTRAVMPQAIELSFPFSVIEVIEMGILFTTDAKQRQRIIEQVTELLSLSHLLHKHYTQCSGGEKQRIQLARVIAQLLQPESKEDKYLLLDESTSAMDLAMMHKTFFALKEIIKQRIGVIAVIHDLNLASHYADSVVLISNKTTSHLGSPKKVITKENIADVFSANVAVLSHPTRDHPVVFYD